MICIPMYQIVFQMFSYANIHDVSWGNRDAAQVSQNAASKKTETTKIIVPKKNWFGCQKTAKEIKKEEKELDEKKNRGQKGIDEDAEITRLWIFLLWLFSNLSVGYLLASYGKEGLKNDQSLGILAWILIIFQVIKLVFSLLYWLRIGLFELDMKKREESRIAKIKDLTDKDFKYDKELPAQKEDNTA